MLQAYTSPPLSMNEAHLWAFGFSIGYVGSLYISSHARAIYARWRHGQDRPKFPPGMRTRDDPVVIKTRLSAVSVSTVVSLLCLAHLLSSLPERTRGGLLYEPVGPPEARWITVLHSTWIRLGLPFDVRLHWKTLLITPLLYLGSLYACYLFELMPGQKWWSLQRSVMPVFRTWLGVRNFIFAPVTEEFIFRSCILAVYHLAGASKKTMIFASPLWFGLAHIHHAFDTYTRYGRTPQALKQAAVSSVFQFAYTTLFGFHTAFLFLRTSSVWPALSAHVFCNIMGIPQINFELGRFPGRRYAIIVAYVVGIVGYIHTMDSWTRVGRSLYWAQAIY